MGDKEHLAVTLASHCSPMMHPLKTFLSYFFIQALSNDEIPFNFSARVSINNLSPSV